MKRLLPVDKASSSITDTGHTRGRGILRFGLGSLQMFVAAFAMVLLVYSGINRWSLFAATLASILTMISVLLFRRNTPGSDGRS